MFKNPMYSPLIDNEDTRIMNLHGGELEAPLSCDLSPINLSAPPPYAALSYVWGTQYSPECLKVNNFDLVLTSNLEMALRQLRHPTKDRVLWIDAVCINQDEDALGERMVQIAKMSTIYNTASRVIAWLGPDDGDGNKARQLVLDLKEAGLTQSAVMASLEDQETEQSWKSLFNLWKREYWNRLWITQELACSSSAIIQFGKHEVDWEDIGWIGRRISDGLAVAVLLPWFESEHLARMARVSARRSLQILLFERKNPPILDLLNLIRRYDCSVPKDRVFGVMGMAKTFPGSSLSIDYAMPTAEIYLHVAQYAIQTTKKLNIICEKEVPPNSHRTPILPLDFQLPSWVPDWNTKRGVNGLKSRPGKYEAAGGSQALPVFSSNRREMTVEGCFLGAIDVLGGVYFNLSDSLATVQMLLKQWLMLALNGNSPIPTARFDSQWADERIDAFWRTLIGNRIRDERPIDKALYRHLFDVFRGVASMKGSEGSFVGVQNDIPLRTYVTPIAKEWGDPIFNRRFFTSGHLIMGLCPPTAEKGDSIVILAGCDHPVILRQAGDMWNLVGEAYVHGFMDREIVPLLLDGTLQLQKLTLC